MFNAGLAGSLKNLVYSQHFHRGDTSWIPNEEGCLEYMPVFDYMFNKEFEFWSGDLEKELFDSSIVPNQGLELSRRYLKPNPYDENKYIVASWILKAPSQKPHHLEKVIKCHVEMTDIYDLGDSRNFESATHAISKIKKIQQAHCYIGSPTSWDTITRLYKKPMISLWPVEW